jgi:hypothetical protein
MTSVTTIEAAALAGIGPDIEALVAKTLREREVVRCADFVSRGMLERQKLQKQLAAMLPSVHKNPDGTVAFSAFAPGKFEEREKLDQRIAKLAKAINATLLNGDAKELQTLLGGKPQAADDAQGAE